MHKNEVLWEVQKLAAENSLSKNELIAAFDSGLAASDQTANSYVSEKISIADILYFVGGGVVVLGISILIFNSWSVLNAFTKILATFGSGVLCYIVGWILNRKEIANRVSQAFFLISAVVIPIGLGIIFDNAGFDAGSSGIQSAISAILLLSYLISFFTLNKKIFLIFSVLFGTWFFFSITSMLVSSTPIWDSNFFAYRALVVGISYILLGHYFATSQLRALTGALYSFGVIAFLGSALYLGGFQSSANIFWEIIFIGLVFGVLFLSTYLKSKSFLVFGSLFLMIYIIKLTAEYFSENIGWPLALVFAGLALIAVGYLAFWINRRFIAR